MKKRKWQKFWGAAGMVCLLLSGCGRELEERDFPSLLIVDEVPLEQALQDAQAKSSLYLDYGQVKTVLLSEETAMDAGALQDVLLYLEENPIFARNMLFFVGDKKALKTAELQKDKAGDTLEDFYKNNPLLEKDASVTLGEMLDYLHNGKMDICIPKVAAKEGELEVKGGIVLEKEAVQTGSSPVWRSAE